MSVMQETSFGMLGRECQERLNNDNDIKIIIQGMNSQTGIGKTTLAIQLCRFIDDDWNAQDKSFIDVQRYLNAHIEMPKGTALLLDEIEHGADSRRAMSQENVSLSQGWAKLRAHNIATVCTLPSTSMLDKRMLELADYWVLVKSRGIAQPYRIKVNDFKPSKLPKREALPNDEHIRFADLPDTDEDKKYLDKIKDEAIRETGEFETITVAEHEEKLDKAVAESERETRQAVRDEWLYQVYTNTELTLQDIADLPHVDISQPAVSKRVKKLRESDGKAAESS